MSAVTPDEPVRRSDIQKLREEVMSLNRHMQRMVADQVHAEVAEVSVPRQELHDRLRASGKRTVAGMLVLLAVIAAAVGANRFTLQQAQRQNIGDFRRLITTCRTTGPPLNAEDLAYCNSRVPGFEQARQRALDTAATARRNQERLARLEAKVKRLVQ